ncbi:MAG: GNAT family N-acetyltransferase [Spirochaetes bacterium]|nr:GNAT family N-acetyltransferase [Spirochaetota bacterium]
MNSIDIWKEKYPNKFLSPKEIFSNIRRGDRIFLSTGCGEPQYLLQSLVNYIEENPKAFAEAEVFHIWTMGVAPYADERFSYNFRHNSFFISTSSRNAVNQGIADYTPIFLSKLPELFRRGRIFLDIALIQTSVPDKNGYVSLGISVDITKAAIEKSRVIVAQMNPLMPRVHGDTFIHLSKIDYIVPYEEPLLEFNPPVEDEAAMLIGNYVAKIVRDGDTLQIGYGSMPNAILSQLKNKKHLGIHSELLTDAMVDLLRDGVIDNSMKTIDRGKTVASFCMGTAPTYKFIDDNPTIEFRTIDYTNHPSIISQIHNMTAINAALQIDLTGQATAESIGNTFYSGIGGSADFMRATTFAPGGKTILVLKSTARDDSISRIVPFLESGTGVTLNRGDVHYVVTEYGIAYLHGKNVRERAMALIAIAHPKFRPWLIDEAKRHNLIYRDQAYIPGKAGEYPRHLESRRTTSKGITLYLRPVKISDEPLIKDFFYSLSDKSMYRRFLSMRFDFPHPARQEFVVIDYTREMVLLACIEDEETEYLVGIGQFIKEKDSHYAELAFAVRDKWQNKGIGTELLSYLTLLGKSEGLHGFTAYVLAENSPMLHLLEKSFPNLQKHIEEGTYNIRIEFNEGA